ncbi:MAG: DUF711 family protein [Anaerolineae bacterium]|nr:DUF711 family protein [Anaerolineae bacterium]
MKIRSITVFADSANLEDSPRLAELEAFSQAACQAYIDAGFEVQTTRLALDGLPMHPDPVRYAVTLEALAREYGFEYLSLGPASGERLLHLPAVFSATQSVFATAYIVDPVSGAIDGATVRMAAQVIREASHIDAGFGNLRFAALAHVLPGTPFFPAAYHDGGAPAFAIATEAADLAVDAGGAASDLADAHRRLRDRIEAEAARLVVVAERLAVQHAMRFHGIDFSLAPFPALACSIGAALEVLTGQPLGASGSLAAAATLTDAIGQAHFPRVGFCGLMLPVLEDIVLAQRAAEGRLNVGELLQWSAVCGTGLDTVPLPGDVSEGALVRLLFDVAALAVRLHKPLTARLMPLPGKVAGDPVHFDFAYFADGGVLSVDGGVSEGLLERTAALHLHARES